VDPHYHGIITLLDVLIVGGAITLVSFLLLFRIAWMTGNALADVRRRDD